MGQDASWYGGRPRLRRHCVRWGPSSVPHKRGTAPTQFSAHVYCGETAVCIRIPLGMEVDLSLGDVLDGNLAPPPLRGYSPQFSANVRHGQTAGWTDMPLGMEVGLSPGDFVLDRDPAPPRENGRTTTQFLAHVYSGQTARWIKMPLGMEVNLGQGDVVLDGVAAPAPKRGTVPQFLAHVYCSQLAGWMKMPQNRLWTRAHCVRWEPSSCVEVR